MYIKATYKHKTHFLKRKTLQITTLQQLRTSIQQQFINLPKQYWIQAKINGNQQKREEEFVRIQRDQDLAIFGKLGKEIVDIFLRGEVEGVGDSDHAKEKQLGEQIPIQHSQQHPNISTNSLPSKSQQLQVCSQSQPNSKINNPNPPYFTCNLCNYQPQQQNQTYYYCSVCEDVDLCEGCQELSIHDHPFVKVRGHSQSKYKVFVVLESQIRAIGGNVSNDKKQIEGRLHQQKVQNQQRRNSMQQKQNSSHPPGLLTKLNNIKQYYWHKFTGAPKMTQNQQKKQKEQQQINLQKNQQKEQKELKEQKQVQLKNIKKEVQMDNTNNQFLF